jgi:hypothetical protein
MVRRSRRGRPKGDAMKRHTPVLMLSMAASVVLLLCGSGCLTAASEAYGGVTGGKGLFVPLSPTANNPALLTGYARFELGELADDFAGRTPPEFFPMLPGELEKALAKKKLPNASAGNTLVLRGRILYYEDQKFVNVILGPTEEVIARMEMVDKASGKVLATAICVGRSTTRTTIGVKYKAEGFGRALAAWIGANYPVAGREKAEED